MYITSVPNRRSPPAILLRESYREDGKVRTRTLANLSSLTPHQIAGMRRALGNEEELGPGAAEKIRDRAHGAVDAVTTAIRRLAFEPVIDSRPSRERDIIVAMIVSRIVDAQSKLATTRALQATTLLEDRGISDVAEDELYEALDWLLERQDRIEKRLAKRHLKNEGLVLYDLSSSYFEGQTCSLAKFGYNRDRKRGKLQVNYGLMTDERGCPVAIRVYEGNTSDSTTFGDQVERVKVGFGLDAFVMVGDRGMISQKQVNELREREGIAWITALKSGQIRYLREAGVLRSDSFDSCNMIPIEHPKFGGERLIACKNHELAKLRAYKRQSLIEATRKDLEDVQRLVASRSIIGKDQIGVRVGKVINKHKVAKHFALKIDDKQLAFSVRDERVAEEAALDGLYVIRTPLSSERASDADAVRHYKKLAIVERAFRSIKTMSLKVRPIHHRLENRVRAHIFLCMLAYYVEWHMREALRPVLFSDEDQAAKSTRDPVSPAKRSESAERKCASKELDDGAVAHSFRTLLADLATITRSTFVPTGASDGAQTFTMTTSASPHQARALKLLRGIAV